MCKHFWVQKFRFQVGRFNCFSCFTVFGQCSEGFLGCGVRVWPSPGDAFIVKVCNPSTQLALDLLQRIQEMPCEGKEKGDTIFRIPSRNSREDPHPPHLTSPHLTSPHLTSPHLTSPHLTSPRLASPHTTTTI